jgi:transglutaminase-like putative cysteine protease
MICPDDMVIDPYCPHTSFVDGFGNTCTRLICAGGPVSLRADGIIEDSGSPEAHMPDAAEVPVAQLPNDTLQYLLASRYCETELLMTEAWRLFGHLAPGWSRVQAICDFVNQHVTFGYQYASCTKTAFQTYAERCGVCRDFAHLAIAFCRCLNIPARYCTSYLGDIGVPAVDAPMDFAGCMEVYLGDAWHSFDPRNNARRIGRIMIARGRDAADVAISTAFGGACLRSFRVWTDEIREQQIVPLVPLTAVARAA